MSRTLVLALLLACSTASAQAVLYSGGGVPEGVCAPDTSCEVVSLTSTSTVQSNAPTGQCAFKASTNGARTCVGGGNAYVWAVDDNTLQTNATFRLGGGADIRNGLISDSARGSVLIGNVVSAILLPVGTPPECAAGATASPPRTQPGGLTVVQGSTGKPHRLCLCTYNGTAYAWWSFTTNTYGNATTCPEA